MKQVWTYLRNILLLAVILMTSGGVSAQTFQENLLYGDEAMGENDYYGAAMYYRNALYLDSSSMKAAWKYAEACRLFNNYQEAANHYAQILERDHSSRYPLSRFWLAMMQKTLGEYTRAGENFQRFAAEHPTVDDYYLKRAAAEPEACRKAADIIAHPLNLTVDHLLDVKVNTSYAEFNAQQLGDTALLFSALRPVQMGNMESFIPNTYVSDLYLAKATQAGWSRVEPLDPKLAQSGYHNANATLTPDHAQIYFTRGKVEGNPQLRTEIWTAANERGKWQKPEPLSGSVNLEGYTSTQPALSRREGYDVLYFVSDRPGGFGKMDLWYVIIKDGKPGEPVNLGSIVNTPGDEITPFYHDSTGTLYFSSDWHAGLGGYDIFASRGALNEWTSPKNIGYPLNTGYNDVYFTVNPLDNDGYLTSNRPGSLYIKSETCCNDIYYYEWKPQLAETFVEIVEARDTVTLEDSIRLLLPLTLYFHNDEPNPRSLDTVTAKNYRTTLSEYYEMKEVYRQEYARGLSGFDKQKAEKDIEDFFENYVGKGFAQLQLFSKLLMMDLARGSRVIIMIKGYCSPLTNTAYNVNLAKRRISSLKNYLREYQGGVFCPYLDSTSADGGVLILRSDPIGESTASPFVSDNPNDTRNSVYSRSAAFERKIQIVLYESDAKTQVVKLPEIFFERTQWDFGDLQPGAAAECLFQFRNTGAADLVISTVETSCGCTTPDWSQAPVPPGGRGVIKVRMATEDFAGQRTETVTVLSNAAQGKVTLTITANILSGKD